MIVGSNETFLLLSALAEYASNTENPKQKLIIFIVERFLDTASHKIKAAAWKEMDCYLYAC